MIDSLAAGSNPHEKYRQVSKIGRTLVGNIIFVT